MIEKLSYQDAQLLLEKHQVFVMPAEVHGVISGLLSCGLEIESKEYLALLSDVFNEGQSFSGELKTFLSSMYTHVSTQLNDKELQFELYLPEEEETLSDQANAVIAWISGFLLGFGLKQKDYGRLSADVKEVIQDFTEISKLDTHFDETDEDVQALYEIVEYVRISTLLCFAELGEKQVTTAAENKTIH